jgi:hypothetical protein
MRNSRFRIACEVRPARRSRPYTFERSHTARSGSVSFAVFGLFRQSPGRQCSIVYLSYRPLV